MPQERARGLGALRVTVGPCRVTVPSQMARKDVLRRKSIMHRV